MNIYKNIDELPDFEGQVVTIGTFDGVHKGHRSILDILQRAKHQYGGESMVLTFWPHPRMILQPFNNELKLLNTLEEKILLLEEAGIDNLIILPFTQAFSRLSYLEFIRTILVEKLHVKVLVIGHDHHFGKNREGSFEQLAECAPLYNFELVRVPAEQIDNISISSTKIRKALIEGDVKKAAEYLGYFYNVSGIIRHGDERGRTIGFPTANVSIDETYKLLPATGVYVVQILVDGKKYYGMANLGYRPTFQGKDKTLEVNIFEFNEMIYDAKISVFFMDKLRNELTFANVDALKKQLILDKELALRILNI